MNIFGFFKKKDQNKSHEERLVPAKKEKRVLLKAKRPRGHQIFQYNEEFDRIEHVPVHKAPQDFVFRGHIKAGKPKPKTSPRYKAWVDPRCIVFHALNMKNAIRRVERWKKGEIDYLDNLEEYVDPKDANLYWAPTNRF